MRGIERIERILGLGIERGIERRLVLSRVRGIGIDGLSGIVGGFDGWGCGRGGFGSGDLLLAVGLLGEAQLVLHLGAKLVGGAAEVGHQLAELARQFGQLLRSEEQQDEEDEDCAVRKAWHRRLYDTA